MIGKSSVGLCFSLRCVFGVFQVLVKFSILFLKIRQLGGFFFIFFGGFRALLRKIFYRVEEQRGTGFLSFSRVGLVFCLGYVLRCSLCFGGYIGVWFIFWRVNVWDRSIVVLGGLQVFFCLLYFKYKFFFEGFGVIVCG